MATRNFVPRKDGEGSIGKERKSWGTAYIDKLFVKAIELLGGGFACNFQGGAGYICFGSLFGGLKIQWADIDVNTISRPEDDPSAYNVVLPISFVQRNYVVLCSDTNPSSPVFRINKMVPIDQNTMRLKTYVLENLENSKGKAYETFATVYIAIGR